MTEKGLTDGAVLLDGASDSASGVSGELPWLSLLPGTGWKDKQFWMTTLLDHPILIHLSLSEVIALSSLVHEIGYENCDPATVMALLYALVDTDNPIYTHSADTWPPMHPSFYGLSIPTESTAKDARDCLSLAVKTVPAGSTMPVEATWFLSASQPLLRWALVAQSHKQLGSLELSELVYRFARRGEIEMIHYILTGQLWLDLPSPEPRCFHANVYKAPFSDHAAATTICRSLLKALARAPFCTGFDLAHYLVNVDNTTELMSLSKHPFNCSIRECLAAWGSLLGKNDDVPAAASLGSIAYFKYVMERIDLGMSSNLSQLCGGTTSSSRVLDTLVRVGAERGNLVILRYVKSQGYTNWNRAGGHLQLTAAHYAAEHLHFPAVEFLATVADVTTPKDFKGLTPVDYLVREALRRKDLALLCNLENLYGYRTWSKALTPNLDTPGHLAVVMEPRQETAIPFLQFLESHDADFEHAKNKVGQTVAGIAKDQLHSPYFWREATE